jgi:hypothetical protein
MHVLTLQAGTVTHKVAAHEIPEPSAPYAAIFQALDGGGFAGIVQRTYFEIDFGCGRSDGFRTR